MKTYVPVDTTMCCPKCGSPTSIRTSRAMSPLLREEYVVCSNPTCDGAYKVNREIVASLCDGSYANGLNIPQSLRRQALSTRQPAPDPNQLDLPGIDPPALPPARGVQA